MFESSSNILYIYICEHGDIVVEHRSTNQEVLGLIPTGGTVLCPCARHIKSPEYWLVQRNGYLPSRHEWKIVDWGVKPKNNKKQTTYLLH